MAGRETVIYADSVLEQKTAIAAIYGDVDFSILPERYVSDDSIIDSLPSALQALCRTCAI